MTVKRIPLIERTLPKIDKTPGYGPKGDCWRWTGAHTRDRAVISKGGHAGQKLYVARITYEHFIGPIPRGLEADHLCRFKPCINPNHLEPVTHQENIRRARGKTVCRRGHLRVPENLRGRDCKACEKIRRCARYERERRTANNAH